MPARGDRVGAEAARRARVRGGSDGHVTEAGRERCDGSGRSCLVRARRGRRGVVREAAGVAVPAAPLQEEGAHRSHLRRQLRYPGSGTPTRAMRTEGEVGTEHSKAQHESVIQNSIRRPRHLAPRTQPIPGSPRPASPTPQLHPVLHSLLHSTALQRHHRAPLTCTPVLARLRPRLSAAASRSWACRALLAAEIASRSPSPPRR